MLKKITAVLDTTQSVLDIHDEQDQSVRISVLDALTKEGLPVVPTPEGFRPMNSFLAGLCGCLTLDLLLLFKEKKLSCTHYQIDMTAERTPVGTFSLWSSIHIHVSVRGAFSKEWVADVLGFSINNSCSVCETLRRAGAKITFEVTIK
ncbi:MAG: OsmC family protein [Phycisphaerales bacterium]|nr:OsmC family protein [Phycisphaerales bacterium]